MSRILDGEYKLTLEDTMTFKNFDDVIGISGHGQQCFITANVFPLGTSFLADSIQVAFCQRKNRKTCWWPDGVSVLRKNWLKIPVS